ncbi:MAG TPA: S26 family signal peptidase, partial [Gemmataceae bacterium]|nr:S26 family signal peptidase [Gemmataceae bacterium]
MPGNGVPLVQPKRWQRFDIIRLFVLVICVLLLLRTFFLDAYHVPTGSMAPTLVGRHRACSCPRCGFTVQVGLHERDDAADETQARWYQHAWCPNCGAMGLPIHQSAVASGQRMIVNKTAFVTRSPKRWEVVVFHLFGLDFIKRILGLPDETVEIKDGDLFVNGALCRKTLEEVKAMRILVFDHNYQPKPMTWAPRWESAPQRTNGQLLSGATLHLDGTSTSDGWHLVAYRHFCLNTKKFLPITDEYAYNGAEPSRTVPVHDLMLECDIEIQAGQGTLALGISDGKDHLIALLTPDGRATLHVANGFSVPMLQQPGS